MSTIDWDAAVQSYQSGPQFKATPEGIVETPPPTPLPELLGLAGGVGGALLTRSPQGAAAGRTGAMALGRQFAPSLFGSSVGTALGLGAESAFQPVSPERAGMAMLENAAWDVGGNLVATVAGKTYRVGKDALESLGLTKAGNFGDAKVAAQKFLSERNATLTKGQLTGSPLDQFVEYVSKGGTGMDIYKTQQEKVAQAVTQGVEDVKKSLETSPAFQQALKADQPLTRAAGENFQALITTARDSFKETYRPFYQKLSTDLNAFVDMKPIKREAQAEYDRLVKSKFAGAGADRKTVLEDILKQDDLVDFGVAHDLRSNFGAAARDAIETGGKSTTLSSAYSKFESKINSAMDNAFSYKRKELAGTPYTQKLVNDYRNTQSAYREGMDGLYNETITEGMKASPSKVGSYIFDLTETEKSTALAKAITQIDKYASQQGRQSGQILGDFKYGFMEQALSSPEKIKKFASDLDQNPETRRAFYKLFKNEAAPLKEILNAADIGLENTAQSSAAAFLRNKATITGGQALIGTVGYFTLPSEMRDKLADNLPEAALSAGAFIITPRLLAKVSTNKEAISALVDLNKASQNPKFGGAAAAKLVDRLNKTGIIDSEYISEVDSLFGQPKTTTIQPQETQKINWDELVKQ
jgi:hypothetical protein